MPKKTAAFISDLGVSVFLEADLDLLWSRVGHKDTRPLLRTAQSHAQLWPRYLKSARPSTPAQIIKRHRSSRQYSIAQMADKVLSALHQPAKM